MADEIKIDGGQSFGGKKIIKDHQQNEYTRVNKHKEGLCMFCHSNREVSAVLMDICSDCGLKIGHEPLLAKVMEKPYAMCYKCGNYKFGVANLNFRVCKTCYYHVRLKLKEYNKNGGPLGHDPFYKHLRKKHGKDWAILQSDGITRKFKN